VICSSAAFFSLRILEQFILKGDVGSSELLDKVMSDLRDDKRLHPQELDPQVATFLQKVKDSLASDHHTAVTKTFRKD
jgi:hypothetical protein